MTLQEALRQNPAFPCPQEILERQVMVEIYFFSFGGEVREGAIVVDRDLAQDVKDLFALMLQQKFPLQSVTPISAREFGWDDVRSMEANNTSGFNYRSATGLEKLSNHALGRAIDINPALNPYTYIRGDGVLPVGTTYDINRPGTITQHSAIVKFLKSHGWEWGGDWTSFKDYQHFEK